jgi:hypothetical protein
VVVRKIMSTEPSVRSTTVFSISHVRGCVSSPYTRHVRPLSRLQVRPRTRPPPCGREFNSPIPNLRSADEK